MARRVDQVEDIFLAILGGIVDPHGLRLDGDAALALDVHAIEHLLLHIPIRHGIGGLNEPVGQRGFPVVNVRDDGEIADM
ncbi:hypothetical protein ROBYS_26290 [Roseobacter sp. OBYS 0001]|nr:hypothetical protein ROBYS_26290 [Roseobacter sp. OBYS 0001]